MNSAASVADVLRGSDSRTQVRSLAGAGVAVALAVVVAVTAATAGAVSIHRTKVTPPLRTALFDPYTFVGASDTAYAMARAAGASYIRVPVRWSSIAPAVRPDGFAASDPTSPGYNWSGLDKTVTSMEAAGLTPILDVVQPPKWAFAVKPQGLHAGTPNVTALSQFATAIATEYDGAHGPPAVHVFQVWNEPNNSLDLSPVSPAAYRALVNAVATAVHGVSASNLVVAGGLDPFENEASRFVSQAPLAYMRSLLCVSMGNPKAKRASLRKPHATCSTKVHLDVWSHHPYTFGGPTGHAKRKDDVSLGDLPKMRTLLQTAIKLHRIVSSHPVQFWVTEFSWDTSPPRKNAAPLALQARWTSESLHQMWKSGVSLVTWFLLEDRPSPSPYQSGLYFYAKSITNARAKPTLTAFRFPFVAYLGKGTVTIWGRNATSDKTLVTIERRHGGAGAWRVVARIEPNRYGIFTATLKLSATAKDWLRATAAGSGNSLAFSLTVPKNQRYGPWGN